MAIRTVNTAQTTTGWNSKIFFPKDTYILRCIDEKVAPSNNSGNPMVTLEWEIVNQAPKPVGDKLIEFDGIKFNSYHVLKCVDPALSPEEREEKTQKYFMQYQDRILEKCGIDCSQGWDDENPPSVKGKIVHASVYGQERKSFKSPTPEQQAKGDKVGDVMIDPVTNKEVVIFNPTIEQIFGIADVQVSRPY